MNLTDEICEFLTGGVSIILASRNTSLVPSIARAKGCRVLRGEQAKLRVFLSAAEAGDRLEDVRSSAMLSATFSLPNKHRTLRFKGRDARIDTLQERERAAMDVCLRAFADAIRPLGFMDEFTQVFLATSRDEIATEFSPSEGFQQTPGPAAGEQPG